jgi:hypothetical protein
VKEGFITYLLILMISLNFFNLPNPSSCTVALGFTEPLTEMSIRNLHGGKMLPVNKDDSLIAVCELIVYKMWDRCYRDNFTFFTLLLYTAFYPREHNSC